VSILLKAKSKDANPDDGLQGHTCYSNLGALGYDQTFDTEMFADGTLYMKNFDVCVTLESTDSGSLLALTECDGSVSQSFNFSDEGTITPTSAPDTCFTLAEATRSGRSDTNQLKVLHWKNVQTHHLPIKPGRFAEYKQLTDSRLSHQ